MANTRELRRRIKSVKNTSQITKAMEMVSATKMRRAQNQALSSRPYNQSLNLALYRLLHSSIELDSPYFAENKDGKVAILLLTTDKSLCGALNTNLFRYLRTLPPELADKNLVFYSIGKKGQQFVVRSGFDLSGDFPNSDTVTFNESVNVTKFFVNAFLRAELQRCYILYPHFVSTLNQEPRLLQFLPIQRTWGSIEEESKDLYEFLIEPNSEQLLDYLLNHYLDMQMYQTILETKASEHSARMIAMKNATDNAKELVDDLTLSFNQVRQGAITNELLEITGATLALE